MSEAEMPSSARKLKREPDTCHCATPAESPKDSTLRLGLFGGSFNPVHIGHLLVARAALEELDLARVCFIPVARSPFKSSDTLASARDRLCMLRLALAGEPQFEIDEQEIRRGEPSYTIVTVCDYARRFPEAKLYYLIGSDILDQLPRWREAESLTRLTEFVVVLRPGDVAPRLPPQYRVRAIKGFPFAVSSSQVRERIKTGRRIDWLTPPVVAEYIKNNRLYL
ncbi:MAG: nicotinate (nicotinamide) nucleotide adenylyltransferase [Verrucomicrobiota bacterium]|nr:nicotinate (nicotinamide) nucleotide adenylyltransferase [Verrucomicrobiota bacterium]